VITLNPIELLDILGNENRRRILQLLSFRPFYFNEMAKRLNVGPKSNATRTRGEENISVSSGKLF
jgi:predicted transcriptional regulator